MGAVMQRNRFLRLLLLAVIATSGANIYGQVIEERPEPISARQSALGGSHVALADDLFTLMANPAGFQSAERELHVAEATLGLSGPIFDIASVVIEVSGGADPATLLLDPDVQDLFNGLYAAVNMVGPISFGYVGGGLGFGLFDWIDVSFASAGTLTLATEISEVILIAGGYSFGIPLPESWNSSFSIGAVLKTLIRAGVSATKSVLDLFSLMGNPMALLLGQPFLLTLGVGADMGLLYSIADVWSFGIAIRDLYSPTIRSEYASMQAFLDADTPTKSSGIIPLDLSLGVAFTPRLGSLGRYISDFKLMLDYKDILDFLTHPGTARNWILHFGLGFEIGLLEALSVRGGFNQGLFSAGLGIDLAAMGIDISMFGTELSTEPGLRPVYNLILSLSFSL
jgi:hypothetical protein